ncbi:MAG: FHA domain-containing protein [Phycisphaerales bacterium]|nr:FHA domain-containing protein [Phycisphaerales bacterium]
MASLVIIEGPGKGACLPLNEPLVSVGRDDTCTFQVLDPLVSRKHLQVRTDAETGRHLAADYRSANGISVNDKLLVLEAGGPQRAAP